MEFVYRHKVTGLYKTKMYHHPDALFSKAYIFVDLYSLVNGLNYDRIEYSDALNLERKLKLEKLNGI